MTGDIRVVETRPHPNIELFKDPGIYSMTSWMARVGIGQEMIDKYGMADHLPGFLRPILTGLEYASIADGWDKFRYADDPVPDDKHKIKPVTRAVSPDFFFPLLPGNNGNSHLNRIVISPSPTLHLATIERIVDGVVFEGPEIAWGHLEGNWDRPSNMRIKNTGLYAYMRMPRPARTTGDIIYREDPNQKYYATRQITSQGFGKAYFDYAIRALVAAHESLTPQDT